jgi:hypothetical protein
MKLRKANPNLDDDDTKSDLAQFQWVSAELVTES